MLELKQAKGGVEFAHLAVDTWGHHGDFIDEAEILQVVDALLGLGVRADDGAPFKSVEYLGGVETKHGQVTVVEHAAAVTFDAKSMRRIVDDPEVVDVGDALNGIYIAGAPIAVHRHDGGGLRGDGGFDLGRVQVERVRVDIDKDRFDAIPQQGMRGGDERIGRCDDFAGNAQGL